MKHANHLRKLVEQTDDKPETDQNGLNKGKIPDYVKHKYRHLFEPWNFDKLLKRREWDHAIMLLDNRPKSIPASIYHLTLDERKALESFIEDELKAGKIREYKSPFTAPCFFI